MDFYFNIEDKNELNEYFKLLVKKITLNDEDATLNTEILSDNLNNRYKDNLEAFQILVEALEACDDIDEGLICEVAKAVNKSAIYIKEGYRTFGENISDTDIIISDPEKIPSHLAQLIYDYLVTWSPFDVYTREALFHMDFIHIHPFEDGNGRTARLIMAFNLIKQGYVCPVIDTLTIKEYEKYIKEFNIEGLTELLKKQALKESELICNKKTL